MRRREDPWQTRGCGELGGCCFRPLDSRPGGEQFLIGEIDQIHKMDRVSEVTFIAAFAVTERMTGLRYGLLVVPVQANVGGL
jgi:hypothetical protein